MDISRTRFIGKIKNKLTVKKRFSTDFDRYIGLFNQVHVYDLMEWNHKESPQPELRFSFWRRIFNISVFLYLLLNLLRLSALYFIKEGPWRTYLADFTQFAVGNRYLTLAFTISLAISAIITLSLFAVYQYIDPATTSL